MKKHLTILATMLLVVVSTYAAFTPGTTKLISPNANQIMIPIGGTERQISLKELSIISVDALEELSGKQMGFMERISFRITQKKLKKGIAEDGSIQSKKLQKQTAIMMGRETGFHLGGFALGLFVGIIGVVIAYVINDDYKRNRIKWAWIGFGLGLIANIALIVWYLTTL